jgi:AraC-like DNA-binding protein
MPDVAPRAANALLEILAIAYAPLMARRIQVEAPAVTLRQRVLAHLEQHYAEPGLGPTRIARALGISAGHLHRVFGTEGETLAQHLRRHRLERARAALADPLQVRRSVSRIAREHGFSTLAHFSRSFRSAYGLSPRVHRKCALEQLKAT